MKSNYLENMILEMSKESEKVLDIEAKDIALQIKKVDLAWKRKYRNENYFLPFICFVVLLGLLVNNRGLELYLNLIPYSAIVTCVIALIYKNRKLQKLDLSLSLTQYGKRQYQIYKDQLWLFKWLRLVIFPLSILCIVIDFIYKFSQGYDLFLYLPIIIKALILGGLYRFMNKSKEELLLKIKNLE